MSSTLTLDERELLAEVEEAAKQLSARVLLPFSSLQKQLKARGIDIRQHLQPHVYRAIAESHLLFGHAAADLRKLELCRWQLSAHDVLQTFGEGAAMSRDFVAEVARFGQQAEAKQVDWQDAKAAMTRVAENRRAGIEVPRGVPIGRMWTPWDVRQAMGAVGLLGPNRDARQQRRLVLIEADPAPLNLHARPATPDSIEPAVDDISHPRVAQHRQAQSPQPPTQRQHASPKDQPTVFGHDSPAPPAQLAPQIDSLDNPVETQSPSLLPGVTRRKRNRSKAQPLASTSTKRRRVRHSSLDSVSSIEVMRKAEKPMPDFCSSPISLEDDHDKHGAYEYSADDDDDDHDPGYTYDDDYQDMLLPDDSLYAAEVEEAPPKQLQSEQSPVLGTKASVANPVATEPSQILAQRQSEKPTKTDQSRTTNQVHFAHAGRGAADDDAFAGAQENGSRHFGKPITVLDEQFDSFPRQDAHHGSITCDSAATPTTQILHGLRDSNWLSTSCVERVIDMVCLHHVRVLHLLLPADNDWAKWASSRPFSLSPQHKIVLVPLLRQSHFTLLSFDLDERTVRHYDSLSQATSVRPIVNAIAARLGPNAVPAREWKLTVPINAPQQPNTADCGVYMLATAMYLMADMSVPQKHDGQLWRDILTSLVTGAADIPSRLPDPAPLDHSIDLMDLATQCRAFTRVLRDKLAAFDVVVPLFSMLSTKMESDILALAARVAPTRIELEQRKQMLEQYRSADLNKRAVDKTILQNLSSAIQEVTKEAEKMEGQTSKQLEHRGRVFGVFGSLQAIKIQVKAALARHEAQFREIDIKVRTKYSNYLAQIDEE